MDLCFALRKVNLPSEEIYIQKMMDLARVQSTTVDFYGFFHTLRQSYVTTVRDCLLEWLLRTHPPPALQQFQISDYFQLIPGETITFQPNERLHYAVYNGKKSQHAPFFPGQMIFTNYRLILVSERQEISFSNHSRYDLPAFFKVISLPLVSIQKLKVIRPRNAIAITSKLYYTLQIILGGCLHNQSKVDTFVQMITGMAFLTPPSTATTGSSPGAVTPKGGSPYPSVDSKHHISNPRVNELKAFRQHYFAFHYKQVFTGSSGSGGGWEVRDLMKEYRRQGLLLEDSNHNNNNHNTSYHPWKVVKNDKYELIESYPFFLMIPQGFTLEQLRQAASFRSQNRVPVITYLHRQTGAVLVRSSQPLVGISRKSSPEDALLLNYYRLKGLTPSVAAHTGVHILYIMDCRGRIAAGLNMISGKGTEEVSDYIETQLLHGNIENIHEVRAAAKQLAESLTPQFHPYQELSSVLSKVGEVDYSGVARWMKHLRQILTFAMITAEKLELEGNSVLVHCSDGWDRTTQVCALAQILLDPYYRTIEGLAVLIEKDWCSFGHKFKDRTGCGLDPSQATDERSPIFLQFLDCLYQIMVQFPTQFEYHSDVLVFLVNHHHSGLFGNFLGNTEKERMWELSVHMSTRSVWEYILAKKAEFFLNPLYEGYPFSEAKGDCQGVTTTRPLWPSLSVHKLKLWERVWNRWNVTGHPSSDDGTVWFDDWGEGANL